MFQLPHFLSSVFVLLTTLVFGSVDKPDILFIFADDMSYEAIGVADMLDIDTPNIDRLAAKGTRFTQAYNMGSYSPAVCIASRSMINTGRFVWEATPPKIRECAKNGGFWSQRLQNAGYQTYMAGKWHIFGAKAESVFDVVKNVRPGMPADGYAQKVLTADGHNRKVVPTDAELPAGYNRPKDEADYENGWKPWDPQHGGFWEGGKHWSEVLADDGIEFIEKASEDEAPFFMYLAFNAPHDPRQAPKEFVDRYPLDRVAVPENFLPEYPLADAVCRKDLRDERLMPYPRTEYSVQVNRQEYFAIITHMDAEIGRMLDALEASGRAENTWIFFTADHGLAVGHHGLCGKQNMYEHSMRVPFVVAGPGVAQGLSINTPIYLQDVMPTTLELAGIDPTADVDFKSLLPLLRGDSRVSHYDSIYGAYLDSQRMIVQGDWKLIHYPGIGVERLYNLKEDPMEMVDLARPDLSRPMKPSTAQLKMQETLRSALITLGREMQDPLLSPMKYNQ